MVNGLKKPVEIKENSIVWTDGWASSFTLGNHFRGWDYVNHKRWFKDPTTEVNTNRCEGAWKWLKSTIPDGSPRHKVFLSQIHNLMMIINST